MGIGIIAVATVRVGRIAIRLDLGSRGALESRWARSKLFLPVSLPVPNLDDAEFSPQKLGMFPRYTKGLGYGGDRP